MAISAKPCSTISKRNLVGRRPRQVSFSFQLDYACKFCFCFGFRCLSAPILSAPMHPRYPTYGYGHPVYHHISAYPPSYLNVGAYQPIAHDPTTSTSGTSYLGSYPIQYTGSIGHLSYVGSTTSILSNSIFHFDEFTPVGSGRQFQTQACSCYNGCSKKAVNTCCKDIKQKCNIFG